MLATETPFSVIQTKQAAIAPSMNQWCSQNGSGSSIAFENSVPRSTCGLQSALYVGKIRHYRLRPVEHKFQYRLFMVLVDLQEVDQHFGGNWFFGQSRISPIQFRRSDYLGEQSHPIDACVREKVRTEIGIEVDGPIRMLTHLRYFGYNFNPVTFYFCYDRGGHSLQAIVADVTNTPWGERHAYVIPVRQTDPLGSHRCDKQFHVSPFMGLDQQYHWYFTDAGQQLHVTIENHDRSGQLFSASLELCRRPFSKLRLAMLLIQFPFITAKILIAIYWQALRLWLKRIPYVPHPKQAQR
ncbi:MAG: DUF1365 domain-containing protein [Planctomycetales bacterium]|nr:DUF1365 domain-containing protein [Planctomycetales bacterium]